VAEVKTKKLVLIGVLIALSFIGSLIKIPSPLGTIGFDSAAGFFAALYLGYAPGAIVIALGYLIIAASASFPLGLLTGVVAVEMMATAIAFRFFFNVNKLLGITVATVLNGIVAPLVVLPLGGWGIYAGLVLPLVIASLANVIVASGVYIKIRRHNIFAK
jgi:hypothetical protein